MNHLDEVNELYRMWEISEERPVIHESDVLRILPVENTVVHKRISNGFAVLGTLSVIGMVMVIAYEAWKWVLGI